MRFDWDPIKAELNRIKHGVTFDEAAKVFDDPAAMFVPDRKHSTDSEARSWAIGRSDRMRTLLVVHTLREVGNVRIISARPAHRKERLLYQENLKALRRG